MDNKEVFPVGRVSGVVPIAGAKNSALLLLAAVVLLKKPVILNRMPDIADVRKMCDILALLNIKIKWVGCDALFIDPTDVKYSDLLVATCGEIRTSVLFLGVMLGKYGKIKLRVPGGCKLGHRPINYHIAAMESFGAKVEQEGSYVIASMGEVKKDTTIRFHSPTVTGTVNAILCAVSVPVETVIHGAAMEPEIDDLIQFLNQAGAKIKRLGNMLVVSGGAELGGVTYKVMPDRIEAGTFLIAAAILGGKLTIEDIIPEHLKAVIKVLEQAGADINVCENSVSIAMNKRPVAVDVEAREYPNFPTDLQPQFCVLAAIAEGSSHVVDHVFPSRFDHMVEMEKTGVKYQKLEQGVLIEGVSSLVGSSVYAKNLRCAAALVLGGMVAEGKTNIIKISELNRGYPDFFLKIDNIVTAK